MKKNTTNTTSATTTTNTTVYDTLNAMTVKELREMAKAKGLTGVSRASKEALIEMLHDITVVEQQPTEGPKDSKEFKVALRAFTGMVIDIYTAEKTSKGYTVTLKSGKTMEFNKKGQQVTKKNNRFANYIEIL